MKTKEVNGLFKTDEKHNNKTIKNILPYFLYSDETSKDIVEVLDGKTVTETEKLLGLDTPDKRRVFETEILPTEDIEKDEGWAILTQIFLHKSTPKVLDKMFLKDGVCPSMLTHGSFVKNKITVGKNEVKFLKTLMNNGILSKEDVDKINTAKKSRRKVYMVVSRNPTDYLMASTDQAFSSCIDLKSQTNIAGLGVLGSLVVPSSFMVYVTMGAVRKFSFKTKDTLTHPVMIQRSYCLVFENGLMGAQRWFPNKKYDMDRVFKSVYDKHLPHLHLDTTNDNYANATTTAFKLPFTKFSEVALPYVDSVRLESIGDADFKRKIFGRYGYRHENSEINGFRFTNHLIHLAGRHPTGIYDFIGNPNRLTDPIDGGATCFRCGKPLASSSCTIRIQEISKSMCAKCAATIAGSCAICHNPQFFPTLFKVEKKGKTIYICPICRARNERECFCVNCGKKISTGYLCKECEGKR